MARVKKDDPFTRIQLLREEKMDPTRPYQSNSDFEAGNRFVHRNNRSF